MFNFLWPPEASAKGSQPVPPYSLPGRQECQQKRGTEKSTAPFFDLENGGPKMYNWSLQDAQKS